jgi:type VI secretion system protein ImpA
MTLLDIESLLQPVSADTPCGPDMEYADLFLQLQELARGKPEQVIGDKIKPGQEPSWPGVRVAAAALFRSPKDLRVAGILHLACLKTEGVAGAEAGLKLMRELLTRYWDTVHPMLDVEDGNDPTFRVNSLISALVNEEVLGALRASPLVESRQFGRHSLRAYRIATGIIKLADESIDPAQELSRLHAAFADVPVDALTQTSALIASAADHLNAIQHILLDKADGIPEDLKPLTADLRDIKVLIDAQLDKRGIASQQGGDEASSQANLTPAEAQGGSMGPIRSRTDVLATIERICEYYAKHEPSSPIPLLLQRAKRLVNKEFMDIIRDLTPSGVSEAEIIGGLEKGDR